MAWVLGHGAQTLQGLLPGYHHLLHGNSAGGKGQEDGDAWVEELWGLFQEGLLVLLCAYRALALV